MRSFRRLASSSPDAMAASIIRTEMPKALAAEPRLRSKRRVLSLSGRGLFLDPTLRPVPKRPLECRRQAVDLVILIQRFSVRFKIAWFPHAKARRLVVCPFFLECGIWIPSFILDERASIPWNPS
jgi:hypothetical protein